MNLYLMRHAEPVDGDRMDAARELTKQGRKDAKRMGKWLRKADIAPDLIFCSPFARATETMKRVMKGLKDKPPVVLLDTLQPLGLPSRSWAQIQAELPKFDLDENDDKTNLLVITHGPQVQNLLLYITTGEEFGGGFGFHMHHGAIALVKPIELKRKLHWMVTPSIVRGAEKIGEQIEQIQESLTKGSRKKATAALMLALAFIIRRRFQRQAKGWHQGKSLVLPSDEADAAKIEALLAKSYTAGGEIAAAELDIEAQSIGAYSRIGLDLLDSLDDTSTTKISSLIKDAIAEGKTRDQIERSVRDTFSEWAQKLESSRASMVGITEIADAFNKGIMAQAKQSGKPVLKEWVTEDDACEICDGNTDDQIEIHEPFESGDIAPPAHPNCRCSLQLVLADEDEE